MVWIGGFPAFVNWESAFTLIGTLRILACFDQWVGNRTEFLVHFINVELNGVEMNFAGIIDQTEIVEQAIHVALHFGIFVHLTIAEFLDGLWNQNKLNTNLTFSEWRRTHLPRHRSYLDIPFVQVQFVSRSLLVATERNTGILLMECLYAAFLMNYLVVLASASIDGAKCQQNNWYDNQMHVLCVYLKSILYWTNVPLQTIQTECAFRCIRPAYL